MSALLVGQQHVQFEETFLSSKCKGPIKSHPLQPCPKAPPTICSVLTKEVLYSQVPTSPERWQCTFRAWQHSWEFWVTIFYSSFKLHSEI